MMIKVKTSGAFFAVLILMLMQGKPVEAGDAYSPMYTDDPSKVFWFVHVSDLHIDTLFSGTEESFLEWVVTDCFDVVEPEFVVATGDLTDSTIGIVYGQGPLEEEWDMYRNIIDTAGMAPGVYYDIIGNHDAYGDEGASFYLSRSVTGQDQGTTQPHWWLELPFGTYHFLGIATTCNDWVQWPSDNTNITSEEFDEIHANLEMDTDSRLTIAMGHHNYTTAAGGVRVDDLFAAYDVPLYIHGHEHEYGIRLSNRNVVMGRVSSLGQTVDEQNVCFWAVDSDCISHTCFSAAAPWPVVIITAPVDAMLGVNDDLSNPYAPVVSTECDEAPLRILAFDAEPITFITFEWDTGEEGEFEQSGEIDAQWQAEFDATGFEPGIHDLTVEISGTATRQFAAQVMFSDCACNLSGEPGEGDCYEVDDFEPAAEDAPEPVAEDEEDASVDAADMVETEDAQQDTAGDTDEDEDGGDVSGGGCSCRVG
ncbi:MAG: metallophosphoesterase [Pseudomonadota bacterium]